MIQDVSNRLLRDFSECLAKTIESAHAAPAPEPAAKPIGGFSLMMKVLWDRVRRLFRRER
jgi:hypothetical protein